MIWILLVVSIGLIGVLGQLLMSFQKRAAKLRAIQEPLHRKLKTYQEHSSEVANKIRKGIGPKVDSLEDEYEELRARYDSLFGSLLALQGEISEEELDKSEENEAVSVKPNESSQIRDGLYQARMEAEAIDNFLERYRNDLDVIKRNLIHLGSGEFAVEDDL